MFLRTVRLFILVLSILFFNILSSKAISPTDPTSEKYLIDHGHSPELVRMINLQKARTEGSIPTPQRHNKFVKFFKNLWFDQDLTEPITDFGYNTITTPETAKELLSPDLTVPVKNYMDERKKDKEAKKEVKSNEININDIKVRETK